LWSVLRALPHVSGCGAFVIRSIVVVVRRLCNKKWAHQKPLFCCAFMFLVVLFVVLFIRSSRYYYYPPHCSTLFGMSPATIRSLTYTSLGLLRPALESLISTITIPALHCPVFRQAQLALSLRMRSLCIVLR
jgi:hypothetical protein